MAESPNEGWAFPVKSRKAHYFQGSMSLCRKWMFSGEVKPSDMASPDDCLACWTKIESAQRKALAKEVRK